MSSKLKIAGVSKVEKSYEKEITFTRGDETYYAHLYWESGEGFELTFIDSENKRVAMPEWAVNWQEEEQDLLYEESLAYTLDELTDLELAE
jgi:hypothetical protein